MALTLTLERRPSVVSCALLDYDRMRGRHGLGFKGHAGLDHVTSAQARPYSFGELKLRYKRGRWSKCRLEHSRS